MIRYVDAYRDQFGVELICRVLANTAGGFVTCRGYRAAKSRPMSDRAIRDQVLGDEIERLHAENFGVYGVRKMYYLMRRQGWLVGRDQVARVMKTRGITGVKRGKPRPLIRIPWTEFTGNSRRTVQTNSGSRTLRMSRHGRGLRMWRLSLTFFPAKSSAGRCPQH